MPFLKDLAAFIKVFFKETVHTENTVFRLHYRFTSTFLLVCFAVVSSGTTFTNAYMSCLADKEIAHVVNQFCYFRSTFTLSKYHNPSLKVGTHIAHPGVGPQTPDDKLQYHSYYLWVPYMLILQAILFYVPHWILKSSLHYRRFVALLEEANKLKVKSHMKAGDKKKTDPLEAIRLEVIPGADVENKEEVVGNMEEDPQIAKSQKDTDNENKEAVPLKVVLKDNINKVMKKRNKKLSIIVTFLKEEYVKSVENSLNWWWVIKLVVCELLNMANITFQIYLVDRFLNGHFLTLGVQWYNSTPNGDFLEPVFPKMTKCNFYTYGPSGSVQHHDALCVISLNLYNRLAYLAMWLWFGPLFVVTLLSLLWRLSTLLLLRRSSLFNRCFWGVLVPGAVLTPVELEMLPKLRFSDWLCLCYIRKNVEASTFRKVLKEVTISIAGSTRFEADQETTSL